MLYEVTVVEHRVYRTVYRVEAEDAMQAEELIYEAGEEVSDELMDVGNTTVLKVKEL